MDASAYADARNFRIQGKGGTGPTGEIDLQLNLIERLAHIHCLDGEIAYILGIDVDTFAMRKQRHPEIQEAIDRGFADGKMSIRRAQFQVAFPDPDNGYRGNPDMLKWLGKNILKQSDKISIGSDNDNPIKIKLTWGDSAKPEISEENNESVDASANNVENP